MSSLTNKMLDKVRSILPAELAKFLQPEQSSTDQKSMPEERTSIVVLDCRSFMAYNLRHITGALNVNCTGIGKRRLQAGKIGVADLLTCDKGKEDFRKGHWSKVVVYDDSTSEVKQAPPTHPVRLVLASLISQGKDALLLKGGIKGFYECYKNLVLDKVEDNSGGRPSLSPGSENRLMMLGDNPAVDINVPATCILPHLYLGNARDSENESFLVANKVKFILNLTCHCSNVFSSREDFHYKQVLIEDNCRENILAIFLDAIDFIDLAKEKGMAVLVHCHAGISRSPTVTIAYLMKRCQMTMKDAYKYVKEKRPCVAPNLNFMGQLMEFEKQLSQGGRSGSTVDVDSVAASVEETVSVKDDTTTI